MDSKTKPILSICIATFNRGKYIKETLDSIIFQNSPLIEIIVVDGASSDQTKEIVSDYSNRYSNFFYYREEVNSGVDIDYDKAVIYSSGDYCWLMTDDDTILDGSIEYLLSIIKPNRDLIVINSEVWNADLSKNLETRMANIDKDKCYNSNDEREMFIDLANCLSFIGSVIIKRSIWLDRDRDSYFGTLFVHVGVIFQREFVNEIYFVSNPMLKIRYGNSMWTPRSFEIWYYKWPKLIWGFIRFDESAKSKVIAREPWRNIFSLLKSRAMGDYTFVEYQKYFFNSNFSFFRVLALFISVVNAKILNFIIVLFYLVFKPSEKYTIFDLTRSINSTSFTRSLSKVCNLDLLSK